MVKKRKRREKKRELFNFNNAMFLLLLIALLIVFKTFLEPTKTHNLSGQAETDLMQEAQIVLSKLTNGPTEISLVSSNQLIEEKIENLDNMDYDQMKNMLGVENDFCIFLEDISGNIVKIGNINLGIGSDKIHINGNPCK